MEDSNERIANCVRLMSLPTTIAEYALLGCVDCTEHQLKQRAKEAIRSCRRVQDWFINHPKSNKEIAETFRSNFTSNEMVLLSELLSTCFGLSEDGLEEIIKAIKQNVTYETT